MKKELFFIKNFKSFSTIEIILSISLFLMIVLGFSGYLASMVQQFNLSKDQSIAMNLASEGLEVVRDMRDSTFLNLSDGNFGISKDNNHWKLIPSYDIFEKFTRTINISTIDIATKKVTAAITWNNSNHSYIISTYLSNWERTTSGNWQIPSIESTVKIPSNQPGVAVKGKGNFIYLITEGNNKNFVAIDDTNTANPVVASLTNLSSTLTSLTINNNYAFVTSTNSNNDLIILDITNPFSPIIKSTLNIPGTNYPVKTFIKGDLLYLIKTSSAIANEFFVINISNPVSPYIISSMNINETLKDIVINENHAYIASSNDSAELKIINISDPANPIFINSYDLTGTSDGYSIAYYPNRLILTRSNFDLNILDVTNPYSINLMGSYNAGGLIETISINSNDPLIFLATKNANLELQILNISTENNPILFGSYNFPGIFNAVSYDAQNDRSYGVGLSQNTELSIFKAGSY